MWRALPPVGVRMDGNLTPQMSRKQSNAKQVSINDYTQMKNQTNALMKMNETRGQM